jgi:hypothetical protein
MVEADQNISRSDAVAGFLAALAVFAGAISVVWYPGRVGPAAMFVGLVAAAMATTQRRLVGYALAIVTLCWLAGMIIAVVLERPIF